MRALHREGAPQAVVAWGFSELPEASMCRAPRSGQRDWSASGRVVASLDRKCLGQKSVRESGTWLRGIFDKETRRKPLAVAADALSYGD